MVCHLQRFVRIVGDQHDRHPGLVQEAQRVVAHLFPQALVQAGERLVQQHRPRRGRERTGERHPLLLPAGELVRISVGEVREAQPLQHPACGAPAFRPWRCLQPEAHVVDGTHVGEQRVVLEHQADAALLGRDEAVRAGDLLAVDQNAAGAGGARGRRRS